MTSITSTSTPSTPKPILPFLAGIESRLAPFGVPLMRVITGLLLMPHGAQKLFGLFGGYGVEATGQFFATKFGLPASFALIAGLIEFFGGLFLAAGFLTRPAAALVTGMMAVAVVQVHLPAGFFNGAGGYEFPLLWGTIALGFVLQGGGAYSVDAAIGKEF